MFKSMLKIIICGLLLAMEVHAAKFDPPDLNLEFRLHQQFLQSTEPNAVASEQGWLENYQLQQGENLWGLSQMLYGDGSYWPRVWAQNRSITNPHLIRKGHTLQFLMGSEDQAPAFRFSESDEGGVELTAATVGNPQIEIPPPDVPPRPVIRSPKSFPQWQDVYSRQKDKLTIDDSGITYLRHLPPDKIPLSAFVQDTELNSVGTFLEVERESGLPVTMQYIYVKVKKGQGHIGDHFLMVKDMGKIQRLNDQLEGEMKAHFIQIFGEAEITDTVAANFSRSRDRKNFDVFRAVMVHATHLSYSTCDLIPGKLQVVDMSTNGPSGQASAQVIGSFKYETSALYGTGDIVFINKGSKDGVQVGQIMDIFIDRTIRDSETPVKISPVASGMLKIAKVSDGSATAVVLSAIDSIQQGDRVEPHRASAGGESIAAPEERSAERFDLPQ
jgi:hypothetical protein